jgi:hypothetical protein
MERDIDVWQAVKIIGEELTIPPSPDIKGFLRNLSVRINEMITSDFSGLLSLLYRLDVDERKLRSLLLQQADADAGDVIAALIYERQLQKIKSRQEFRRDDDIDENEKW